SGQGFPRCDLQGDAVFLQGAGAVAVEPPDLPGEVAQPPIGPIARLARQPGSPGDLCLTRGAPGNREVVVPVADLLNRLAAAGAAIGLHEHPSPSLTPPAYAAGPEQPPWPASWRRLWP